MRYCRKMGNCLATCTRASNADDQRTDGHDQPAQPVARLQSPVALSSKLRHIEDAAANGRTQLHQQSHNPGLEKAAGVKQTPTDVTASASADHQSDQALADVSTCDYTCHTCPVDSQMESIDAAGQTGLHAPASPSTSGASASTSAKLVDNVMSDASLQLSTSTPSQQVLHDAAMLSAIFAYMAPSDYSTVRTVCKRWEAVSKAITSCKTCLRSSANDDLSSAQLEVIYNIKQFSTPWHHECVD